MIQIRPHTFETNSSSTHSLIICSDDEYKAWENGGVYLCVDNWFSHDIREKYQIPHYEEGVFYSIEEINKLFDRLHANESHYYSRVEFFRTFNEYLYDKFEDDEDYQKYGCYLESYNETYTTKGGETIHVFGKYGND